MRKIYDLLKPYLLYLIIGVAIILITVITYFVNDTKTVVAKVEEKVNEVKEDIKYYKVDIKGAVLTPGVYSMSENSRVIDVINLAGGILENADTGLINLSKKITDEMVIIIYTNEEIREYNEGKIKTEYVYIEVNNCPDSMNNACINGYNQTTDNLININTATSKELQALSGIGEAKANSIIEYRNKFGNFKTIEDIKNISGISDLLFDKIKEFITI